MDRLLRVAGVSGMEFETLRLLVVWRASQVY
jgi:hypothetical protein